jgi:superfamily II DNA or RNA helicase
LGAGLTFTEITEGIRLTGIIPGEPVEILSAKPVGNAVEIVFRKNDGSLSSRILYEKDLAGIRSENNSLRWQFNSNADDSKLAIEAYRIKLAHLFDPHLAVYTSMIEALPHQISAVYKEMLPRQPLRFLLADDPGAGKTIMTGLLIKELMLRGDLKRCLIVSPGNLVEQWQDELYSKFQLNFSLLTNESLESSARGNAFLDIDLCIARLDKLSRNEDLHEKLKAAAWDLIVCDEAHKMSAAIYGEEEKRTKRYNLGMLLSTRARHFLLLTATPHNGKDDDFRLFLKLLDADRFIGKNRGKEAIAIDTQDIMRRLVKEKLLTFDAKPLFPERWAYTLSYELSPMERDLYEHVTAYVRQGWDAAVKLVKKNKINAVGFALTILQRRLSSSPEAIYQSLRRRRGRLEKKLEEIEKYGIGHLIHPEMEDGDWEDGSFFDDLDDAPEEEINELEEDILDEATAAQSKEELINEIYTLKGLEELAGQIRTSGRDTKWKELAETISGNAFMFSKDGAREKIIIFTEHRDTLNYLRDKIRTLLGSQDAVVTIQGGMHRAERKLVEESFKNDPNVIVLVATDAAGEGINLQRAHLMVNYDLPWNPNRLEQRFGRIHRIGQHEVCHLWNLVAMKTREGDVFLRLFRKLENERKALGGQVFDVLGKVNYNGESLRDLLIEAIRYGNRPDVKEKLNRIIDGALDKEELERLIKERSLNSRDFGKTDVIQIKEDMERLEARRLQPHYIESFFKAAYGTLNGQMRERPGKRYSLPHVPKKLYAQVSSLGTAYPIAKQYEAITFEKEGLRSEGKPDAALICPGHPLLSALIDIVLSKGYETLKQGTILIDETEAETGGGRLLFYIDDALFDGRKDSSGNPVMISHRLHFLEIFKDGEGIRSRFAGYAPHLDYRSPTEDELPVINKLLRENAWWGSKSCGLGANPQGLAMPEDMARQYAIEHLTGPHRDEIEKIRVAQVNKVEAEVKRRLDAEISYWDAQAGKMYDKIAEGVPNARINAEKFKEWRDDLEKRKEIRLLELARERNIIPRPPVVLGGAWIIPRAMIRAATAPVETGETKEQSPADAKSRAVIEQKAMERIMAIERELGNNPFDVSADKEGYDIRSVTPNDEYRFIEVKGRAAGIGLVTVTHNEMKVSCNKKGQSFLAVVEIDGARQRVTYFREWRKQPPSMADHSATLELDSLRKEAEVVLERDITA